jgi:hypothetical protein
MRRILLSVSKKLLELGLQTLFLFAARSISYVTTALGSTELRELGTGTVQTLKPEVGTDFTNKYSRTRFSGLA